MIAALVGQNLIPEPARTLAAMVAVVVVLAGLFGALRLLCRMKVVHPEAIRKLLHVGMGLVVLTFPWVFDSAWPVIVLAGGSALALILLKLNPALRAASGGVIEGVGRESLGEVYYPISVGVLWVMSDGAWLLFVIPMLILTLADALAALIGVRYGKTRYQTWDGAKSLEGSIAFFAVAFLSVHVPLLLFTEVGRAETLWIAVILGLLAMLIEAISWKGLDNIYIPLGAFALLNLYLPMPAEALVLRVGVTVGLVIFVFAWRGRTTLDDSALVASAFFGYAAWMVGGWLWLLAPLAVFVANCLVWPRREEDRSHHLPAVVAVTAAGLTWLFIHATYQWPGAVYAYATAFAAHLAKIGVSSMGVDASKRRDRPMLRLAGAVVGAFLAAAVPTLAIELADARLGEVGVGAGASVLLGAGSILCVTLAAGAYYGLLPWLYDPRPVPARINWSGGLIGVSVSILAAGVAYGVMRLG
jgi:phytol kinase